MVCGKYLKRIKRDSSILFTQRPVSFYSSVTLGETVVVAFLTFLSISLSTLSQLFTTSVFYQILIHILSLQHKQKCMVYFAWFSNDIF